MAYSACSQQATLNLADDTGFPAFSVMSRSAKVVLGTEARVISLTLFTLFDMILHPGCQHSQSNIGSCPKSLCELFLYFPHP